MTSVAAVIPALDEEASIGAVVAAIDRTLVDRVIVVDNGSSDRTADRARAAGAEVVFAARRGYGSACLAGIAAARSADVVVFLDGDGSDDPAEIAPLLAALLDGRADLALGARTRAAGDPQALTPVQRLGNALACALIRRFWGVAFADLGPFRAVRRAALDRLDMRDPGMGWTIEMQVKAARRGLAVVEIPVSCRPRRAGASKISGSLVGSFRAGCRILSIIARAGLRDALGLEPSSGGPSRAGPRAP